MINIYINPNKDSNTLEQINEIEKDCWVNMVSPTNKELLFIFEKLNIPINYLDTLIDNEEIPHINIKKDIILVVVDTPSAESEDNSLLYETYPLKIICTENQIITICVNNSKILNDFINGKVHSFFIYKKSRFILQILYKVSTYYLIYLRQIDKKSVIIEKKLTKSMKNKGLIQLLSLKKSLIYFSTSLKANEITFEKMFKLEFMTKYEEDQDVLQDVIIENKQAIEMTNVYSDILSSTMGTFASIISNNLNIVMKLMASITIIMSIPNIISGLLGMNFDYIPGQNIPYEFWIIIAIIIFIIIIVINLLNKKDMF